MKLAVLFTGGKDSTYAAQLAKQQGHEIVSLITIKSENASSYMFHTPAIELTELQAEAMQLPHIIGSTEGKKEKELADLKATIEKAKSKYSFEGIITGALFSKYQESRIAKICAEIGLKCVNPLWHKPQEQLMQELLNNNFKIILTAIAGDGFDQSWLGKEFNGEMLSNLKKINKRIGTNVAFEGGEAESLVLDCPLFQKELKIIKTKKVMESECSGKLIVEDAALIAK